MSDTGEVPGGVIGLEAGANYNSTKGYFAAGSALARDMRFHIDGYAIRGRGLRDLGFDAQKGYQKANLTKDLGAPGFMRLNLKLLDDTEPVYTAYPSLVHAGPSSFSGLSPLPGFDARTGSTVGIYNEHISALDSTSGQLMEQKSEGLHPVAHAYGAQLHLTPGGDLTIAKQCASSTSGLDRTLTPAQT